MSAAIPSRRHSGRGFVERTTDGLLSVAERALFAERIARSNGLLQSLDPRVKVIGLLLLTVAVAMSHSLSVIGVVFAVAVLLAVLSRVPISEVAARAWTGAFLFTGTLAAPALFLTPGRAVAHLPMGFAVTEQGIRTAAFLLARVETAVTLTLLLIVCTLWSQVLYALRVLRVPVIFVVILGMTYRYIFVLLQSAHDIFEARRSRQVGKMTPAEARRNASASAGVLLSRTLQLSGDVYLAMQSRGFRGEVYLLDPPRMSTRDWIALTFFIAAAGAAIGWGR